MRHIRLAALALALAASAAAAGCWHRCGQTNTSASSYYSPCCGTPTPGVSTTSGQLPPMGIPTNQGPMAPCPNAIR